MKYAKKMRLVEIDNELNNEHSLNQSKILHSDEKYAEPRVLSALDNMMNNILKQKDMSDSDKWTLYNQVLQRYLALVKKKDKDVIENKYDSNNEFETSRWSQNTGDMMLFRDSIDTISAPSVRAFFEKAREADNEDILRQSFSPSGRSSISQSPRQSYSNNHRSQIDEDLSSDMDVPQNIRPRQRRQRRLTYPNAPLSLSQFGKTRSKTIRKRQAANNLSVTKPKVSRVMPEWTPVTYK